MNKKKTINDIKKAYIKLKSDLYYSNNMFYKNMIAEFEKNNDKENVFSIVCNIYNGNNLQLKKYLDKISIFALPKKVECSTKKESLVYNLNDNKSIQSLNFFIDAPIEIFLLDVLWTLDIGIICKEKQKIKKDFVYGNVLSEFKIYQLDVENTTFFEPYFYNYSEWRNKAFSTIQKMNPDTDVILINYDIRQYYYNYQVNFDELSSFLEVESLDHFKIIESIYKKYNRLLKKYKNIPLNPGRYSLPIGLYSSRIISNIALYKYDEFIEFMIDTRGYYGRYVDDMILVLPVSTKEISNKSTLAIRNIVDSTFNFLEEYNDKWLIPPRYLSLGLTASPLKLEINPEKIDIYYFEKNNENITEELFKNKILMRVSDIGYYIEDKVSEKTLINDLFNYKNSKYINKISDLKDTSIDKYGLSIMLTKMISYYKNTSKEDLEKEGKVIPEKIISFLTDDEGIKYYQYWEKIFNLLNIFGSKHVKSYYQSMQLFLKNNLDYDLPIDELKNIEDLKSIVKKSLIKNLAYCKDISLSINNLNNTSNKWINSLMVQKNLLNDPFCLLAKNRITKYKYDIDLEKINYVPYWITFEEVYLYENMQYIIGSKPRKTLDEVINLYCNYNKVSKNDFVVPKSVISLKDYKKEFISHDFEKESSNGNRIISLLNQISLPKKGIKESEENFKKRFEIALKELFEYTKYYIGIVSLPLDVKKIANDVKNRNKNNSLEYKRMINHILNEAINNNVNHLVFPELSIPYEWIKDILYFAKRHKIQVTFGLQFLYEYNPLVKKNKVYNCICSIYPFKVCGVYKLMYFDLREKKHYSYDERKLFEDNDYDFNDERDVQNTIVKYRGGFFTNILCFELTSIKERAQLIDSITNLFVPVLNKDTKYFSSIVDSTARELYCYVALANTSIYGDSRITGPFSSVKKDIVRLKGGKNCYLAVGSVNISELKDNRKKQYKKRSEESDFKPLSAGTNNNLYNDELDILDIFDYIEE